MGIFQRNGKFWISYSGIDGKRHREAVGASRVLAKEALAKRMAEKAEHKFFPGRHANRQRFGVVLNKFWDLHGRFLRSGSWRLIANALRECWGGKAVCDITAAEIQRYYNEVCLRASPSTANRHFSFIRLVFNKAWKWGDFHGENPCGRVDRKRENPHRLRFLTAEEIRRLLGAVSPRLYPVVVFAMLTGMRRGEIFGLDWRDVDMVHRRIHVVLTKSGKARVVPICPNLEVLLRQLGPRPSGLVFDVPYITMRRHFDRALKDAGISDFRFHDFRHTFASHFIMKTKNLPALQMILGHATPAMTNRYAHLAMDHIVDAMNEFQPAIPLGRTESQLESARPVGGSPGQPSAGLE